MAASPFRFAVNPVAGNTGSILHDASPFTDQFIEKGAFSHIGATHDCHNRFCHSFTNPFPKVIPQAGQLKIPRRPAPRLLQAKRKPSPNDIGRGPAISLCVIYADLSV
jgi:hypothetical protein